MRKKPNKSIVSTEFYTDIFFGSSFKTSTDYKGLHSLCDNGTTTVYIDTPKGWKCKRKGCTTDFKHTHSTYPSLYAYNTTKKTS